VDNSLNAAAILLGYAHQLRARGRRFKALLRSWHLAEGIPLNPPRKLSIAKILLGAFILPWWHRRTLFRALAAPGIALVSIDVMWCAFAVSLSQVAYQAAFWVLWIVRSLLWLLFAVTVHRIVLLEIRRNEVPTFPDWGRRETLFLGWAVAVYGLAVGASLVAGMVFLTGIGISSQTFAGFLAPYLTAAIGTYVLGRLAVVFPATAIDHRTTLGEAWNLTRGNDLRMMVIVGVLPWSFSYLWYSIYGRDPSMILVVLVTAIATVFVTVEIAALSLAYRELSAERPQAVGGDSTDVTSSSR
jgi:hypothetical protein